MIRLGSAQQLLKLRNSIAIVDTYQLACGKSPLKNRPELPKSETILNYLRSSVFICLTSAVSVSIKDLCNTAMYVVYLDECR